MFEHTPKPDTLILCLPVEDEIGYEQMEQRIICRRNRAPQAGLLWIVSTSGGKVEGDALSTLAPILQQVVRERHPPMPTPCPEA